MQLLKLYERGGSEDEDASGGADVRLMLFGRLWVSVVESGRLPYSPLKCHLTEHFRSLRANRFISSRFLSAFCNGYSKTLLLHNLPRKF